MTLRDMALAALSRFSQATVESWTVGLVKRTASRLPPAQGLRLLFRIEAAFYPLAGRLAVAYGGGEHVKHRHTGYHNFFVARVEKGERVLDIGCGKGELARDLASRAGARVVGIDNNDENVKAARSYLLPGDVTYGLADATRDFPDGQFDVVVLSNILEHLKDRPAFLRRLATRTGARGILVRVPLFERDWRVPLKRELGVEWRLDPTHEIEYTAESFAAEVREAGFTIRHAEHRWGEIWAEILPDGNDRS